MYDFENHLISANGVTYTYDGDGHRVSKTVNGKTITYATSDIKRFLGRSQLLTGPKRHSGSGSGHEVSQAAEVVSSPGEGKQPPDLLDPSQLHFL